MNHVNKRHGFTLVELMLSMGFVSALLLAIAMTVIQMGNIYNRGITFKNVNQVGSAIANELQRTIASSISFDVGPPPPIAPTITLNYVPKTESGRLCTGQYSYVWNYGKYIPTNTNLIKYTSGNAKIFFVKVYDPGALYCTKVGPSYPNINPAKAVELLDNGQYNLAIHSFKITSYGTATNSTIEQKLYSISFSIGTNDQSVFDVGTTNCSISGPNANSSFCAVNRFDIVARAGNASNGGGQ